MAKKSPDSCSFIAQIGLCLAVGLGALVLGMGMFAAGWIGGGDGKLFAVCALWMGWPGAFLFLVYTGLAGGVLTFAILTLRSGYLVPAVAGGPAWLRKLAAKDGDLPYGVAIAAGALCLAAAAVVDHAAGGVAQEHHGGCVAGCFRDGCGGHGQGKARAG